MAWRTERMRRCDRSRLIERMIMAIVYADVRLGNFGRPDLEEMTATAVEDSGAGRIPE
jgi:hypothetical protein